MRTRSADRVQGDPAVRTGLVLSEDLTRGLHECAGSSGLEVDTIIRAAWIVTLDGLGAGMRLDGAMSVAELLADLNMRTSEFPGPAVFVDNFQFDPRVFRVPDLRPQDDRSVRLSLALDRRITLSLVDESGRFDEPALDQIADCLLCVLEALVVGRDQPICRIEVLGDEEWIRIFGAQPDLTAFDITVPELIADLAQRTPDAVAVIHGGQTLTYAELDRAANRCARRLTELGCGPGQRLRLDLPSSPELVIGLLAALKLGAVCLPAPAEGCIVLDGLGPLASYPDSAPSWTPSALSLAYVDTQADGKQRYVLHGDLVNRLLGLQAEHGISSAERVLRHEDDAVWELFWPLIVGAALVLSPPPVAATDQPSDQGSVAEPRPTQPCLSTSDTLDSLLRSSLSDSCRSLRQIRLGEEVIPAPFARPPGRRSGTWVSRSRGP